MYNTFIIIIYFLICLFYLFLAVFIWSIIIVGLFGPPIVPTPKKIIKEALASSALKPGDFFIDLGSGTGRVVRMAVEKYKVKGLGVERNPFLVWWARLRAVLKGLKNIEFKRGDFFKADISKADTVFLYLFPKYLSEMARKIKKECRAGTIVISQGFFIEEWSRYLVKEIGRQRNSTYIYRIC